MDIVVKKTELLATLQTNREEHARMYQEAIEKFRERAMAWFNEQVDALKAGKDPERNLPLPRPEEHTDDYDRAIEMMTWDTGEDVKLDDFQFDQFVRNQWGWHRSFITNTTSYLGVTG